MIIKGIEKNKNNNMKKEIMFYSLDNFYKYKQDNEFKRTVTYETLDFEGLILSIRKYENETSEIELKIFRNETEYYNGMTMAEAGDNMEWLSDLMVSKNTEGTTKEEKEQENDRDDKLSIYKVIKSQGHETSLLRKRINELEKLNNQLLDEVCFHRNTIAEDTNFNAKEFKQIKDNLEIVVDFLNENSLAYITLNRDITHEQMTEERKGYPATGYGSLKDYINKLLGKQG